MLLQRRRPWGAHPDRPTPPRGPVDRIEWAGAELAGIHHDRLVQVVGYMDDLIDSQHFVVPSPWWPEVAAAPWLEVVDLDDDLIWRISGEKALRENARVIRRGVLIWMLYLPCFDVTRLDRRYRGAAQQATTQA